MSTISLTLFCGNLGDLMSSRSLWGSSNSLHARKSCCQAFHHRDVEFKMSEWLLPWHIEYMRLSSTHPDKTIKHTSQFCWRHHNRILADHFYLLQHNSQNIQRLPLDAGRRLYQNVNELRHQ